MRAAQNIDNKLISKSPHSPSTRASESTLGRKSIVIAVTLQPREKTMTDQELAR